MKRYKVVGSSKPEFMDIEMNITFDDVSIGRNCEVFGDTFTITQTGTVLVLANPDWVLTLQEIVVEPVEDWTASIKNPKDLRINHEVDVFLKDKIIKLNETDRLREDNRTTYLCLFRFLKKEWRFIEQVSGVAFPLEYDGEFNLFIMRDEWNFGPNAVKLLTSGSYSRYNAEGRCI